MTRRQRGVTTIGWIFLLVPVALVLYAGIRVGPEYLNYYKVISALKETATKLKSDDTLTAQSIGRALERRFDTGYIDNPAPDEIIIKKSDAGWEMTADYEPTVPLMGNLYLTMQFKKTVVIN
jgi:Domain of unknown function (DUF4845)